MASRVWNEREININLQKILISAEEIGAQILVSGGKKYKISYIGNMSEIKASEILSGGGVLDRDDEIN